MRVFLGKLFAAGVFSVTSAIAPLGTPVITPEELSRLLDAHGARLALFARQRCRSAEDVIQEAFVALASQRSAPRDPVAWLYRAVRNRAASAARAEGRRGRHEEQASVIRPAWFEPTGADAFDAELAASALAELPLEERETVVLRVWSGLSFQEIADLTETSTSTAHRRYEQALAALRRRLGAPKPT